MSSGKREKTAQEKFTGVVRAVNSGDMLVVQKKNGSEVSLILSGIQAPRLGNLGTKADEPHAWESREFLRRLVIGRNVDVTIVNTVGDRHYANVSLSGRDVVSEVVASGFAKVRPQLRGEFGDKLRELEEEARNDGLGIYSGDAGAVRKPSKLTPLAFFDKKKKEGPCSAVIEGVRSGNVLRVVFVPENLPATVILAGVSAPGVSWDSAARKHVEVEAGGLASVKFLEDHVNHRDAQITLRSVDKNDNFVAQVNVLKRDLATELAKMGLVKVVAGVGVSEKEDYRTELETAQKMAQEKSLGIWKGGVAAAAAVGEKKAGGEGSDKSFEGTVVDIPQSGILVVRRNVAEGEPEKEPVRMLLASIKAPRVVRGEKLSREDEYHTVLSMQGREALRRSVFGKTVRCEMRYSRSTEGKGETTYWDVYRGEKNIAIDLVDQGLVEVMSHRANDPRSYEYDGFVLGEKRAKTKKVGLFADIGKVQLRRINDLTSPQSHQLSSEMLPHFHGAMKGVVDFVFSPLRMKVMISSESCLLSVICAGIQCPKPNEKDIGSYAEEGIKYLRNLVHLREIDVRKIETVDKAGNFIATVYYSGKPLAVSLLENGFAWVQASADRLPYADQLYEAEKKAKEGKIGLWKSYVPPSDDDDADKTEDDVVVGTVFGDVEITAFGDYGHFYFQSGDENSAFNKIQDDLAQAIEESADESEISVKKGDYVAAPYGSDDEYYRAQVVSVKKARCVVHYLDVGSEKEVSRSVLRKLPKEFVSQRPLVHLAVVAFIKPPNEKSSWAESYEDALSDLTDERQLEVRVEGKKKEGKKTVLCVTLLADEQEHVGCSLLREGYALLDEKECEGKDGFELLKEAQERARTEHKNIWQHGDVIDFDDDDE